MRTIVKGDEPVELTHYRSQPHAYFDGFPDKDILRRALAAEQGYLCAYCMQRIDATGDGMKIEHWRAQDNHPERALSYRNMLGVCMGGEGRPRRLQHCDTHKGNHAIHINPLDDPEKFIRYLTGGIMESTHPEIQRDLDDTLNLNIEPLTRGREAAWDGIYTLLKSRGDKAFSEGALRREIARFEDKGRDGEYQPYCRYVTYFLEKKLKRIQARKRGSR